MNSKIYETLKFIIDNTVYSQQLSPEYIHTVMDHAPYVEGTPFIFTEAGTDYDLYRNVIGNEPQPVPELKLFFKPVAESLSIHPCWVGWAGIFDRKLTQSQRKALTYYRIAFLILLTEGLEQEAYAVMSLAQNPLSGEQITMDLRYSKNVLHDYLLKNETCM